MARVLLAWELGDGLGHVGRLLPVARALRAAGHDCLFAVRGLTAPYGLLKQEGFPILQAPYAVPTVPESLRNLPMGSLADILATVGYGELDQLAAQVQAWEDLMAALGVALAVADYAPTLCLAAMGRTPVVAIGDGFTLPPAGLPSFPLFNAKVGPRTDESALLATVQELQRRRGRPVPASLPGVMGEARSFIVTLAELDPRADGRGETGARTVVGPLAAPPPPAAHAPTTGYFAYLSTTARGIDKALAGLAESGLPGSVYLRDATAAQAARARDLGLTLHDRPQPLASALADAAVLVHHGGLGTAEAGLAVGRPQLLIPRHQEQAFNAQTLGGLGVAVMMMSGGRFEPQHVAKALHHLREQPKFTAAATARAADIARRGPFDGARQVAEACLYTLSGQA